MLNVVENEAKGTVVIGDYEVEGFIDDQTCPECKEFRIYNDDYDAFFCPQCNVWLESACSDPTCDYCSKRPWKPLPS